MVRMRRTGKIVVTLVMVLLLVLTAACAPTPKETPPTSTPAPALEQVTPATKGVTPSSSPESIPTVEWGIIEIRVTDPPPADVKSAIVYLTNIEVHKVSDNASDNVSDNAGGWISIIGAPPSFDLMDVIGVEKILGSANITAGSFTQIRMEVTQVEVVTTDNVSYTAEVPGDKLKIVGAFNVGGGQRTILTLDFDGEKSLIRTGQGKFLFKPVVKLLINKGGKADESKGGETGMPSETGKPGETGAGKGNSGERNKP